MIRHASAVGNQTTDANKTDSSSASAVARIDSLTSLRGLVAIWVLIHNDSLIRSTLSIDSYTQFVARGYLAVDFFFVLSGFVLTMVHGEDLTKLTWQKYRDFVILRLARIYPLYALLLLARVGIEFAKWKVGVDSSFLGPAPFTENNSPLALAANFMMIQAWGFFPEYTWIPTAWSVSADWFAYLAFPLLITLLYPLVRNVAGSLAVGAFCISLLAILVLGNAGSIEFPMYASLLRCIPEFMIGIALGFNRHRFNLKSTWSDFVIALLAISAAYVAHRGTFEILFLVCVSLLIPTLAASQGLISRAINFRALVYLGELSYAIYLSHMIIQSGWRIAEGKLFDEMSTSAIVISSILRTILILISSAMLFHFFEVPTRRWIRKAFTKRG